MLSAFIGVDLWAANTTLRSAGKCEHEAMQSVLPSKWSCAKEMHTPQAHHAPQPPPQFHEQQLPRQSHQPPNLPAKLPCTSFDLC